MTQHLLSDEPEPEDDEENENNPLLCDVIERNIRTLSRMREREEHKRNLQDRLADIITFVSGRMEFVYLHIGWFGVWLLLNTGRFGVKPFDPYPYGLLTMIVSLEAIFLSTFVLISQNRLSEEADRRADLDLHVGLLTEYELTRVLQMLDAIQDKLGIENQDEELLMLEHETRPEDVLAEIQHVKAQMQRRKQARLRFLGGQNRHENKNGG